jgi:peptidoglycan-associated lipoprotein
MRLNRTLAILAALALVGGACKKKEEPIVPQQPRTMSTPPVVPANPTPAPTPRGEVLPPVDDVTRVHGLPLDEIDKMGLFTDIYFDLDQSELRAADRDALARNVETLKKYFALIVTLEGHADERGTVEYNLALSDRRARVVHDHLISMGIPASRLKVVAYGKEIPVCTDSVEDCWQRNRRAHFAVTGKTN